jgi:RNA polymerase subunit RPABC4/transcription elongation factor Spt4
MKVCEYCGTRVADNVMQCAGCGSKEFKNICLKCGSVISGNKCPKCEAGIKDRRNEQVIQQPVIRRMKPKKNYKLIAVLALLYFGIVGFIVTDYMANPENYLSVKQENPESQEQTESQKKQKLTYAELITLKDHPKYYEDYK